MTFRLYALRTGALVWRHTGNGKAGLSGAELIAEGDPLHLPKRVYDMAWPGDNGTWFVPGGKNASGIQFKFACEKFRDALERRARIDAAKRSRSAVSPSGNGDGTAGPGGV